MTPQQKAGQLFDKYFNPLRKLTTDINYQTYLLKEQLCKDHAKDCALIAIDEILEATKRYDYTLGPNPSYNQYWLKVKYQLEQL